MFSISFKPSQYIILTFTSDLEINTIRPLLYNRWHVYQIWWRCTWQLRYSVFSCISSSINSMVLHLLEIMCIIYSTKWSLHVALLSVYDIQSLMKVNTLSSVHLVNNTVSTVSKLTETCEKLRFFIVVLHYIKKYFSYIVMGHAKGN